MAGKELVIKAIQAIESRTEEFRKSLPAHLPAEKFVRVFKNAIGNNPKLADVPLDLLIVEVSKAAADGLICDGREAAITLFKTKRGDEWIQAPKYIPMYQGLIKRARNTGEVINLAAYLVYENEVLSINPETGQPWFRRWIDDAGEHVTYTPMTLGDPGRIAGAFSQAKLKGGHVVYCWMSISQLDKIRNRTKSKDRDGNITGPWRDDTEEMFKKTVIRRHSKTLPMDSDLANVFSRDDDMYSNGDDEPPNYPRRPRPQRGAAAAALAADEIEDAEFETAPDEPKEEAKPPKGRPAKATKTETPPPADDEEFNGDDVF